MARKPKKTYPIPNIENLTMGGAADILGDYREKQKELKFYEGFYSEYLKSRMKNEEVIKGEKFAFVRTDMTQERFDTTALQTTANGDGTEAVEAQKTLEKYVREIKMTQMKSIELDDEAATQPN